MTHQKQATWTEKLTQSRTALRQFLATLTPAQWQTQVFSEGANWTVTNVVAHIIEAERGMSIHVHKIRKGQETLPPDFDLEQWNSGVEKRMGDQDPAALQQLLVDTQAKTLEVMNSLQEEDWAKTGQHPSRGLITIEQYYETIYGHDQTHLTDIKQALGLA